LIKYIIILGAGKNQLPFILESKKLGFKTIVFDRDKTKIGYNKADLFYDISIYNYQEILRVLEILNLSYHAIIARVTSSQGLLTGYEIAHKYNLTFASKLLINLGTNKTILAKFCQDHNIPAPKTKLIKNQNDISNVHISEKSTYILKPSMTIIGKKNIQKFNTKKELSNNFELTQSISANDEVLVQEYINGIDTTVFVHFCNNRFKIVASWDEIIGVQKNNHIKGLGLVTPSTFYANNKLLEQIYLILETFNQLLVNENYLVAFSFKINNLNEAYLIEIHIDLTGDLIAEQLLPSANQNFNFFQIVIDVFLGNNLIKEYEFMNTLLLYENCLVVNYNVTKAINILKNISKNYQLIELDYLKYLYNRKTNKKAIIHIGASELQIESIKCAKELNLYIIATDINKNALGISLVDEYYCISGNDEDNLLALAKKKNQEFEIIGVYGNSDFALFSIAKIHKVLNIKGPTYSSVQLALDKFKSKTVWLQNKISTPEAFIINDTDKLSTQNLSYPLIVKPKDSCGSQGIKSVNNQKELLMSIDNAFNFSDEVIIENFISGKHYDTIGIVWDNQFIPMGIGNRYFTEAPYHFPLWGHSPSDLSNENVNLAYDITQKAIQVLGLNNTPVKADLIFDNKKFYVLEVTPRFHGDVFTSKMIPFSCNEKPIKNLFQLYLNDRLDSNFKCSKRIIWKAIFPKKELKDLQWLNFNIKYKDVYFNFNKKTTLIHVDNRSLLGFIWFQVPDDYTFMQYNQYITKKLGDYIL